MALSAQGAPSKTELRADPEIYEPRKDWCDAGAGTHNVTFYNRKGASGQGVTIDAGAGEYARKWWILDFENYVGGAIWWRCDGSDAIGKTSKAGKQPSNETGKFKVRVRRVIKYTWWGTALKSGRLTWGFP